MWGPFSMGGGSSGTLPVYLSPQIIIIYSTTHLVLIRVRVVYTSYYDSIYHTVSGFNQVDLNGYWPYHRFETGSWIPLDRSVFLIPHVWGLHVSFEFCMALKVTWTLITTMGVYGDYDDTVVTPSHRVVMGWTSNLPDKVFRSPRSYLSHLLSILLRGLIPIRGQIR